jgi:vacuolar protein sorting-associated protein 41
MAAESETAEDTAAAPKTPPPRDQRAASATSATPQSDDIISEDGSDEDEEEDEEGDDEPKLKYTRLTDSLGSVYRNGDATSAFTIAGDKMVCYWVSKGS